MSEQDEPEELEPGRRLEAAIHALMAGMTPRLSITKLAKDAHVTRGTLYEWFSGERPPSSPKLAGIAEVLEVPVSELWAAYDGRPQVPVSFEDAALRLIEEMRVQSAETRALRERIDMIAGWAASAGVTRAGREQRGPVDRPRPRRRRRKPAPPESEP